MPGSSFADRVNIGMALPHNTAEMGLGPVESWRNGGAIARWGYVATQFYRWLAGASLWIMRTVGVSLFAPVACAMYSRVCTR